MTVVYGYLHGDRRHEWDKATQDRFTRLLEAALAEAGYPVRFRWNGEKWVAPAWTRPPVAVVDKARMLVLDYMGEPWTIEEPIHAD